MCLRACACERVLASVCLRACACERVLASVCARACARDASVCARAHVRAFKPGGKAQARRLADPELASSPSETALSPPAVATEGLGSPLLACPRRFPVCVHLFPSGVSSPPNHRFVSMGASISRDCLAARTCPTRLARPARPMRPEWRARPVLPPNRPERRPPHPPLAAESPTRWSSRWSNRWCAWAIS